MSHIHINLIIRNENQEIQQNTCIVNTGMQIVFMMVILNICTFIDRSIDR